MRLIWESHLLTLAKVGIEVAHVVHILFGEIWHAAVIRVKGKVVCSLGLATHRMLNVLAVRLRMEGERGRQWRRRGVRHEMALWLQVL